jgi:hypothetical protein
MTIFWLAKCRIRRRIARRSTTAIILVQCTSAAVMPNPAGALIFWKRN